MNPLIEETLKMRRWAVVGATDDPAKYGYRIFAQLRDLGYEVQPVHPTLRDIDGVPVYASISDLPVVPEVVDMVVNPRIGIGVMREIADAGIRHVWLQPGTRSDEIREFADKHGIELIEDCVLIRTNEGGPH